MAQTGDGPERPLSKEEIAERVNNPSGEGLDRIANRIKNSSDEDYAAWQEVVRAVLALRLVIDPAAALPSTDVLIEQARAWNRTLRRFEARLSAGVRKAA